MSDQAQKVERFRALHIPGRPLVLFNIWDAGSGQGGGRKRREGDRHRQLVGSQCQWVRRRRTHAEGTGHG